MYMHAQCSYSYQNADKQLPNIAHKNRDIDTWLEAIPNICSVQGYIHVISIHLESIGKYSSVYK